MNYFRVWNLLLILSTLPLLTQAQVLPCRQRDPDSNRPRIGLVLGGGGARGFAHVSVIKELERLQIPVDCIAGTSAGALVGGFYASGMSAAEIETLVTTIDWRNALKDSLTRPERSFRRKRDDDLSLIAAKPGLSRSGVKLASGLLTGESIQLLLERVTLPVAKIEDFNQLPIPFRAVATDINTGEAVVIDHGNLGEAMRASMSIPGMFRPVRLDNHLLVDGGIANQLPVDVMQAMGADIIIAVDVGTPLATLDEGASVLAFAEQVTSLITVSNTAESIGLLRSSDILIQPAFDNKVLTGDFDKVTDAMVIGQEALLPLEAKLAALGVAEIDSKKPVAHILSAQDKLIIDFVRLDNQSKYSDALLLARLDIRIGQPLNLTRLEDNILHIYGMDTLDKVSYDVVEEKGRTGMVIHVVPHRYGPNYLETGLSLYSNFTGDFLTNLQIGALRAPINPLGGEARILLQLGSEPGISAEIYQPLDIRGRYFVGAKLIYETPHLTLFGNDANRTAIYQVPTLGLDTTIGREFGNYGALAISLRRHTGSNDLLVGTPALATDNFQTGEMSWSLAYDRLDSFALPRNGGYLALGQTYSRQGFGADTNFDQLNFDAIYSHAIGPHAISAGLRYHQTTNGDTPFQSFYRLGGLTRFVGYRPNELVSPNYALAFAGYSYELGRILTRPMLLGSTVEYGEVWGQTPESEDRRGELNASVYFGFDSWLGRLLFGYGARENGDGTVFLELGRPR